MGWAEGLSRLRSLTLAPDRRIRRIVMVRASILRARCARRASERASGNRRNAAAVD